jgi:exocyst complex protein 7
MRTGKAAYLEVFSPLVSCLMDAGETSSGGLAGALKNAATGGSASAPAADRERRLARFADALTDIEGLHRTARLDPGEAELRERVRDEVERMVIPSAFRSDRTV